MQILWDEWTDKYRWELVGVIVAIIAIGVGVFLWQTSRIQPESVQVLSASANQPASAAANLQIIVDVGGAVVSPGVYSLSKGSRVDDALKSAGGLISVTDIKWIEVNLNRAEVLRDGMKIYIPAIAENKANITQNISASIVNNLIDINSASLDQLDALSGIGPVTANKIISNRPYANIDELLNKKVVSKSVFAKIKDQIRAW